MFKKATSSILEGIKNKMQKIDEPSIQNEEENFLGLDDGFETLNSAAKNNQETKKSEYEAPKRNFNAEIEEIEKVMNADVDQNRTQDSEYDEIDNLEDEKDVEDDTESSDEEEDLEDLQLEEKEIEESAKNDEIEDIEEEFHDFDLEIDDDIQKKNTSPDEDLEVKNSQTDSLSSEVEENESLTLIDEEDHESESDFEMKDVQIKKDEDKEDFTSIQLSPQKSQEDLKDDKSVTESFFGEFNEKEEIEIADEDEFDSSEEITFDSDEFAKTSTSSAGDSFFSDNISLKNSGKESLAVKDRLKEEIEEIILGTGIEEDFSESNITDTSDQNIELSFDDIMDKINIYNNKMSLGKAKNEGPEISSSLLSQQTIKKSSDIIKEIVGTIAKIENAGGAKSNQGITVEEMVVIMLQPKLEEWLNNHLPEIVERVVRDEVRKIMPDRNS